MKTVITYGTFDLLHPGHIRLLKRAKELGDYLIVGLSTCEFNTKKHKESFLAYNERKEMLEAIRYVDKVISEVCWEQMRALLYDIDAQEALRQKQKNYFGEDVGKRKFTEIVSEYIEKLIDIKKEDKVDVE